MPLFILGLVVLLCILAYAIARYYSSGEADRRPVREKYPEAFARRVKHAMDKAEAAKTSGMEPENPEDPIHAKAEVDTDDLRGDLEHLARNLKESAMDLVTRTIDRYANESGNGSDADPDNKDDKTIIFPTDNVEAEKQKRNITSD